MTSFVDENKAKKAFNSFGILEEVLSYADTGTLVMASAVNRRWMEAGRNDDLWKSAIRRLWRGKKGVTPAQPLFWRSLFTKEAISRLSEKQIRALFDHPFLAKKRQRMGKCCLDKVQLEKFLQDHVLDVMIDGPQEHKFFSDIYFGSFASSCIDSKRGFLLQEELCSPYGYDLFFKITEEEIDEDDRSDLLVDEDRENIFLYHHSTCYFEETSGEFKVVLSDDPTPAVQPIDFTWRWIKHGDMVQVGPYPPLVVSRRKDWGWRLENEYVVLFFRDQ